MIWQGNCDAAPRQRIRLLVQECDSRRKDEGIVKSRFNTHKAIALPNPGRLSSMNSIESAHADLAPRARKILVVSAPDRTLYNIVASRPRYLRV
jgi:hypothetical protein